VVAQGSNHNYEGPSLVPQTDQTSLHSISCSWFHSSACLEIVSKNIKLNDFDGMISKIKINTYTTKIRSELFYFHFSFLSPSIEIRVIFFKNLLCHLVFIFIDFDSYSSNHYLFWFYYFLKFKLFFNFILRNFISFNFFIQFDSYFFITFLWVLSFSWFIFFQFHLSSFYIIYLFISNFDLHSFITIFLLFSWFIFFFNFVP